VGIPRFDIADEKTTRDGRKGFRAGAPERLPSRRRLLSMTTPNKPKQRPGRGLPLAKDQPAPTRKPIEPVAPPEDEGWEKGRPKDTGRGGA